MSNSLELKVSAAREVVLALDRAIRIRRLYPSHNARSVEATESLVARFLRFFDVQTYLRLSVGAEEIRFEDHVLLKNVPRPPAIPFVLWVDGLRELRFHRGLSRDEILEFLAIVGMDPKEVKEQGADYVWLLWAREFSAIDCGAVDEFDPSEMPLEAQGELAAEIREAAQRIGKRVGAILADLEEAEEGERGGHGLGGRKGDGDVPSRRVAVGASLRGEASFPRRVEEVFSIDVRAVSARIRATLDTDNVGGALTRALSALGHLPGGSSKVDLAALVRGFAQYYATRKDFSAIGHLLGDLETIAESIGVSRDEVWGGLEGEALAKEMVEFLNLRSPDDMKGLLRFLDSLGPRAGALVCEIYPRIASARTRGVLAQYIAKGGQSLGPALRGLLQAGDHLLAEVLDLVGSIRPTELVKDLQEFARHPSFEVRSQAIEVLSRIEGYERTKALMTLLDDPDPRIRIRVLEALAATRDLGIVIFVTEWIGREDFAERIWDEKVAAFAALAIVRGNATIPFLERHAMAKVPRRGKALASETAQAAVAAIRRIGTGTARTALERIAASAGDPVGTYARQALRS